MGNYSSKRENNDFERSSSKRWKKSQKPRNYYKDVSDLDAEYKVPVHLHYRSRDSVEDDLFMTDEKIPCLIHLHQLATNDTAGVFRGSEDFRKPTRPKSFDPHILLGDEYSTQQVVPAKSTMDMVPSPNLSESFSSQSLLPTPKEKMEIECSQHKSEVIAVDTSGAQFERRVHLRKSQRSSISAVRRKNQQKFRERHKTLTALPGCIANELGLLQSDHRPSIMPSDRHSNSSFFGDTSVISGGSTFVPEHKQHLEIQTDDVKILTASPTKRRLKNRHSMPNVRSVPVSPQIRVKEQLQVINTNGTFPRNRIPTNVNEGNEQKPLQNGHISAESTPLKTKPFMREKTNMVDDRMSSGFWSGTESCRHSTTSETLVQNQNVKQALQQMLSRKSMEVAKERFGKTIDGDSDVTASTLSLNSRLSTLEDSLMSSSSLSLNHSGLPPSNDRTPTAEESMCIPRSELDTSCRMDISSPKGAYHFMNLNYIEPETNLNHLTSPMNLLVLGDRRGNDGLIKIDCDSTNSSIHSLDQDGCNTSMYNDNQTAKYNSNFSATLPVAGTQERSGVRHPRNVPPEVVCDPVHNNNNNEILPQKKDVVDERKSCVEEDGANKQLQKRNRSKKLKTKPVPPRRASSLKYPRNCETEKKFTYMEPSLNSNEVTSKLPTEQSSEPLKLKDKCHLKKRDSFGFSTTGSVERKRMSSAKFPAICRSSTSTQNDDFQQPRSTHQSTSLSIAKPVSMSDEQPSLLCSVSPPSQPKQPICNYKNNKETVSSSDVVKGSSPVAVFAGYHNLSIYSTDNSQKNNSSERIVNEGCTDEAYRAKQIKTDESSKQNEISLPPTERLRLSTEALQRRTEARSSDAIKSSACFTPTATAVEADAIQDQETISHKTEPRTASETLGINWSTQQESQPSLEQKETPPFSPSVEEKLSISIPAKVHSPTLKRASLKCVVMPTTENSAPDVIHCNLTTKPTPVSVIKPSVAAKPSKPLQALPSNVKPIIRPKPVLLPKPRHLEKENKEKTIQKLQVGSKSQQLKDKTASARAAFFGIPFKSPVEKTEENTSKVKVVSPAQVNSQRQNKEVMFDGETDIDAVDATDSKENLNQTSKGKVYFDFEVKNVDCVVVTTEEKLSTKIPDADIETVEESETKMENVLQEKGQSEKDRETEQPLNNPDSDVHMEDTSENQNAMISAKETVTPVSTAEHSFNGTVFSPLDSVDEQDGCSPTELTAGSISSPKSLIDKKPDFKTSMQRLRGSLRQSSEEMKILAVSPSSLERRSYPRCNTSSLDRRRRTSSGSTSREDFKALLLQTSPKGATGSQMSATEKLQKSMHSSKTSRRSYEDENASGSPPDTPRPGMVSMGDIRSVMGTSRQGRRPSRTQDFRKSYAGCTSYSYKKHPPLSHNGRFHTRSRTPTRPMMAISEDVEIEASSDPKEEPARPVSVSDL